MSIGFGDQGVAGDPFSSSFCRVEGHRAEATVLERGEDLPRGEMVQPVRWKVIVRSFPPFLFLLFSILNTCLRKNYSEVAVVMRLWWCGT